MNVRIGSLIFINQTPPKPNGDPPPPMEMASINAAKRYIRIGGGKARAFRRFKDVAVGPDNIKKRLIELITQ